MEYLVKLNGETYKVEICKLSGGAAGGTSISTAQPPEFLAKPKPQTAAPAAVSAPTHSAPAAAPAPAEPAGGAGAGACLRSPMPGTILSVHVGVNDAVKTGQVLVVMEAMKMESEVVSPVDGVVKAVHVQSGQSVSADVMMIEFA